MEPLLIATNDQLNKAIQLAVETAVVNLVPELIRRVSQKEYMSISETCDLLSCTRRHLQHLRNTGRINYIKRGKKIYFRKTDVDKYLNSHLIEFEE